MKLTVLAVVTIALGIVLGLALARGVSEGPASAAPKCPGSSANCPTPTPTPTPPPQQREDQITVAIGDFRFEGTEPDNFRSISSGKHVIGLDASKYPAATTFTLEVGFQQVTGFMQEGCARLFDTAGSAVSGSDLCWSFDGSQPIIERLRSSPFSLPAGLHEKPLRLRMGLAGPAQEGSDHVVGSADGGGQQYWHEVQGAAVGLHLLAHALVHEGVDSWR